MNKSLPIFRGALKRRLFAHKPSSTTCDCNEEYVKRIKEEDGGGSIRIAHTACKDGKQDSNCPVKMIWWKSGIIFKESSLPRTAQLLDEVLVEWGVLDPKTKINEFEKV